MSSRIDDECLYMICLQPDTSRVVPVCGALRAARPTCDQQVAGSTPGLREERPTLGRFLLLSSVIWYRSIGGWEGNRRSGVALAMRYMSNHPDRSRSQRFRRTRRSPGLASIIRY